MNKVMINNEYEIAMPDGLREMTEDELKDLNMLVKGDGVCFKDEEKHIMISIGWKKTGLMGALLSAKDLGRNLESTIAKSMQYFGYRGEGLKTRNIAGKEAWGIRYSYTAQEVPMTGESWALKDGKTFYFFHIYLRTELKEESLMIWDEILDSAVKK